MFFIVQSVVGHCSQPLDLNHQLVTIIIVTFVGKWITASVIHLIRKKAAGALCRQLSVATYQTIQSGCLFKVVRRDQIDIQGVRAYY